MPRKSLFVSMATVLMSLGMTSLFAVQTPKAQPEAASPTNQSRTSLDAEMMDHQKEMQVLATSLVRKFQAIADARDKKGFVRDDAMLKAYSTDIKALRDAYRAHQKLIIAYEHECNVGSQQADTMIQHQQVMKSVLYDVVDTFDTYENANAAIDNPNIVAVEYNGEAIAHHQAALKELSGAVAQHQQAIGQMQKNCS